MLVKLYGEPSHSPEAARRYSPTDCVGALKDTITGNPDPRHISMSYTERANLTMRMSMRRFTRLTNAFSKKLTNHAHMVALYALWYNFVRIHKTLRVYPGDGGRDRKPVVVNGRRSWDDRCPVSEGQRQDAGRVGEEARMGSMSLLHWIVVLMIFALPLIVVGIPIARILRRAGFSRVWCLLCFLPYGIGLVIGVWVFAFVRWPAFASMSPARAAA